MKKRTNQYWFKRRRYGYGWTPVKIQGWLMILAFLGVVFGSIALLSTISMDIFVDFLIGVVILCLLSLFVLILVAHKKGPAPKWRWGKKSSDNLDEDF